MNFHEEVRYRLSVAKLINIKRSSLSKRVASFLFGKINKYQRPFDYIKHDVKSQVFSLIFVYSGYKSIFGHVLTRICKNISLRLHKIKLHNHIYIYLIIYSD